MWLGCRGAGRAKAAGWRGRYLWLETQKPSRGRGEGGEVTSAEYLQANERTEKAAKPREMMDLRTAFILLCGCCREETGERGGEGVSEARGSVSVCSCVLGRCCCIWGCCGLGAHCRDGLVAGTEVVVGGEGVGSVFCVRAAERTSAAGLLWVSQSGAYLRKTGVGGARVRCRMIERPG